MKKYFLQLSYDGTNYCGWQRQKTGISIQQLIEDALSMLFGSSQSIIGCGRTDTGVHADVYFAHWSYDGELPPLTVTKLNGILPRTISIHQIFEVSETVNARYDATSRTYKYFFHTFKNPFLRHFSTEFPYPNIDINKMREVAGLLLKYSEFKPLIKLDREKKKTTCILFSSQIVQLSEHTFYYEISANRFLHNMVRRIMGTLFMIGRHKLDIETFVQTMNEQSEFKIKALAPSQGLHLVDVSYPFISK